MASLPKPDARLRTLFVATAAITAVLVLIDVALNLVLMLFHVCAIEVDAPATDSFEDNFFVFFYHNYLAGEFC